MRNFLHEKICSVALEKPKRCIECILMVYEDTNIYWHGQDNGICTFLNEFVYDLNNPICTQEDFTQYIIDNF